VNGLCVETQAISRSQAVHALSDLRVRSPAGWRHVDGPGRQHELLVCVFDKHARCVFKAMCDGADDRTAVEGELSDILLDATSSGGGLCVVEPGQLRVGRQLWALCKTL
jgi:hypothetical protein